MSEADMGEKEKQIRFMLRGKALPIFVHGFKTALRQGKLSWRFEITKCLIL